MKTSLVNFFPTDAVLHVTIKRNIAFIYSTRCVARGTDVRTEVCGLRQQEISALRADWLIPVQLAEELDSPGTVGGTFDYLHPSTKQTHPVVRYMCLPNSLKIKQITVVRYMCHPRGLKSKRSEIL